jgi:hypothetical protein
MLTSLSSDLVIGYLDDLTLGGTEEMLSEDLKIVKIEGESVGLKLNVSKCELINKKGFTANNDFQNFLQLEPNSAHLLGAPLCEGPAMDKSLQDRCNDLKRSADRLQELASHDALLLLRVSFSAPKMLHILRSSPCSGHTALDLFDDLVRDSLQVIVNSSLSSSQWTQATLPVCNGGLGIRRVATLAPSAFLASAACTHNLQTLILAKCPLSSDKAVDSARSNWSLSHNQPCPIAPASHKQSTWAKPCIDADCANLLSNASDSHNKARLLAAAAPHSGDWLHALPLSCCGLRLDDESIRVAVGLRLGINLCEPHECPCGALVDARGTHGLSCKRSAGRTSRHFFINDLIWRALTRAGIPSIKEPSGLSRTDGKRPDGLTLIPWHGGKSLIWDVTIVDTVAVSHLAATSSQAGGAASRASTNKEEKYAELSKVHNFVAIAIETHGPINSKALTFIQALGKRLSEASGDPRETAFLLQRLSVAIQRFNAVCFSGSFTNSLKSEI